MKRSYTIPKKGRLEERFDERGGDGEGGEDSKEVVGGERGDWVWARSINGNGGGKGVASSVAPTYHKDNGKKDGKKTDLNLLSVNPRQLTQHHAFASSKL